MTSHFGAEGSSKGAVPGEYVVTVSKHVLPPGITQERYDALKAKSDKYNNAGMPAPPGNELPALVEKFPRSANATDSQLKATVVDGESNDFQFELK